MKGKFKSFLSCILIGVMLLGIYEPYNIYATETDEIMTEETTQMPVEEDIDSEGEASEEDDEKISVTQITAFEDNEIFQNPIYVDNETSLEEIVAAFPDVVIAFDDKENKIEISNVEWACQDEIRENWSELEYSFMLPEIYALGEGVQIPTITICREQSEVSVLSENEGNATEVEDGTEAHPYLIYTYDDFEKVRQHLESGNYFKLMNDIDAENVEWKEIGTSSSNYFCANFDGNGHCIYNLEKMDGAIFGCIKGATIKNLGIRVKDGVQLTDRSAILCRYGTQSTLERCYVIGDLISKRTTAGLLTASFSGSITECFAQGYISCTSGGGWGSNSYCMVGGIVGASDATISNCLSYVTVEMPLDSNRECNAGGICGGNISRASTTNITNCFFLGEIIGRNKNRVYGQIYGNQYEYNVTIKNSYYSKENSRDWKKEQKGIGKNIDELRQQSTYEGWDFENIWTMNDGQNTGFPMLRCMVGIERDITKYEKPTCVGFSTGKKQTLLSNHIEFSIFFDRNINVIQNRVQISAELTACFTNG